MRAGSTRCFGAAAASGRNSMLHGQIQLIFLLWHGLLISSAGNFRLAGVYSNGFGVEAPDQERAFTLFKMAATQGHKVAKFMVGMFCQRGIQTAVDLSEARIWCELSAAQGLESAMQFLQSLTE
jgi:TPR repeat protein